MGGTKSSHCFSLVIIMDTVQSLLPWQLPVP